MSVGKIIKFLRCKDGLTQEELAEILGVTKNSIQKYESNEVPNLKTSTIRQLSKHFGISAKAFIFPEEYRDVDLELAIKLEKDLKHHYLLLLNDLNDKGRRKVFEYAKDLRDSKNYSR